MLTPQLTNHYLETSVYTYAGLYADYFKTLPNNPAEIGNLVCSQVIHRITLQEGNTNANANLIYGDMNRYPWYRLRCEDDILLTATAMTAELFRMDPRGFVPDRAVEHKIVVCCRYVSVLMAAILKAKGIPCRCRAGFAPYFKKGTSLDHWINQYWDGNSWITIDADAFMNKQEVGFDQYNMSETAFDWAGQTWLAIRNKTTDGSRYIYADGLGTNGLKAALRYLLYDFHAVMNNEITFSFLPSFVDGKFDTLTPNDFALFDRLATLLTDPDTNYTELCTLWNTDRRFRQLNSPLVEA